MANQNMLNLLPNNVYISCDLDSDTNHKSDSRRLGYTWLPIAKPSHCAILEGQDVFKAKIISSVQMFVERSSPKKATKNEDRDKIIDDS